MKKFTLSNSNTANNTDSDSSRSIPSLHGSNEINRESELPRITVLMILFPDFGKKTSLKVIGDAILLDIKYKLLKAFGPLVSDGQNMGLFLPGVGGKLGKFLEEERLLSEYACEQPEMLLEFIYKRRMVPPFAVNSPLVEKFSKDLTKAFVRYVSRGDHKKVEKILAKGFDPNFQCPKTGETPLTIAATRSKPHNMISVLIAGGAHRDYYSKSGMTPLHKATAVRNFEAVKTLLDFGQSPNGRDRNGLTPLYLNILCDSDKRICHRLLYEHSELGVVNREGLQEIHQAARLNRVDQINLLIMYGADVNSRCARPTLNAPGTATLFQQPASTATGGDTPLHIAASAGQREAVLRLLSWGADPTLTNSANQTAVQLAQACGHAELAEAIRLFRGNAENGAYGGTFLPTPTYNPRRRMRHPPANSIITDPTALIPFTATEASTTLSDSGGLAKPNGDLRPIQPTRSFDRRPTVAGELDRFNSRTELVAMGSGTPRVTKLTASPLSRAVSLGELAQRGVNRDPQCSTNKSNVTQQPIAYPTSICNSFFLATQPHYDSTRTNRGNGAGVNSYTVTRRAKPSSRTSEINASAAIDPEDSTAIRRYASVQTSNFAHPTNDGPRQLHRLGRVVSSGNKTNLQSWKSTDRLHEGFQREGSQTDSGISNSSVEKKPANSEVHSPANFQDSVENDVRLVGRHGDAQTMDSKHDQPDIMSPMINIAQYRPCRSPGESLRQAVAPHTQTLHRAQPARSVDPIQQASRTFRPGVPHTVVLYKNDSTQVSEGDAKPSFGLSIRTVKNSNVVASFQPTPNKPSLQIAKRIVPNSPADRAGICEGDFVLKINGVDVTRATLEEVVNLLTTTAGNSVCLTVLRPLESGSRKPDKTHRAPVDSDQSNSAHYYSHQSAENRVPPADGQSREAADPNPPIYAFVRPVDTSQPQSARSSDRTTCSSIPASDEGIWSQSPGPSSNEVSARNSLVSRLRNLDTQITLVPALRSSMDQKLLLSPDNPPNRVRFRGLPRSRTTTGIAMVQPNQPVTNSISQSLYFARNPRFRRVGSEDSQSSMSSSGVGASSGATENAAHHPLTRSTSGAACTTRNLKHTPSNNGTTKCVPIDSFQIRATRDQLRPTQRISAMERLPGTTAQPRQRSVQPTFFRSDFRGNEYFSQRNQTTITSSRSNTPSTTVDSLTDSEIVLPPPVQFRS